MNKRQRQLKEVLREEKKIYIKWNTRPTQYDSSMIEKAQKYVKKCVEDNEIPYLEELALSLGVSEWTLKNWEMSNPEFSEVFKLLKTTQKLDIKRKALTERVNPGIAKLLLSAEHDVVERVRSEVVADVKLEQQFSPEQEAKIRRGFLQVMEEATK